MGSVKRKTKETEVEVTIDLDGTGVCIAETPVGFLNHMLDQISSHGLFDLTVRAKGDTWIDDHHTVEDIALALGGAMSQALGDRKGIHRFGEFSAPLDEVGAGHAHTASHAGYLLATWVGHSLSAQQQGVRGLIVPTTAHSYKAQPCSESTPSKLLGRNVNVAAEE